jgi:hypothetical protein
LATSRGVFPERAGIGWSANPSKIINNIFFI